MEHLNQYLEYDENTGRILYANNHRRAGKFADRPDCHAGYRRVTVSGKTYKAHRVVWYLYTGYWPGEGEVIDHINGIKWDNHISNLRLVDHSENMRNKHKANKNNDLGILGVRQKGNKYEVRFLQKYLGLYDTIEEAKQAYQDAKARA